MEIACAPDKPSACRTDRHWAGDTVDRVAPDTFALRTRQIPLVRETLIPAKGLAHSGLVHWNRDPEDWFDVRMPNSFEVSRDAVAERRGEGAWQLPATPGQDQGVEATFEFPEQIVGFPRFTIEAPAGAIVEMMSQEGHDPEKNRWLDSHHFSWSRLICREGVNQFEAADFESLRWLQLHVRNAARPVVIRGVGVRRRQFPWPQEPLVRTSEPDLQRLFDAGINTLRNSAIETIVDGMGREPYPRLARFADTLWGFRRDDGLLPVEDLGVPVVWIDFTAFQAQRHKRCAFNLYAAAMYSRAFAPLAELMGEPDRAAEARRRGDALLEAARRQFWSFKHRVFVDNLPWLGEEKAIRLSDRTLANAILFDQCPDDDTAAAIGALAECPPEMGLSYPCNAGWRYWALGKAGRADVILNDFRTKWATTRSVIENNTLQEHWRSSTDGIGQWSHCALAPIYVLFQEIVGLRPLEPGFARLQLRPQLGDLGDLEVIAHTPRGPVEFRSTLAGNRHHVEVRLCKDIEAELVLPPQVDVGFRPIASERSSGLPCYQLPPGGAVFDIPQATRRSVIRRH